MSDSSDFYFYNRVTSATYMVIGTNSYFTGNVGIGTTSPGAKLDVAGSIAATNITLGSGTIGSIPSWMKVITTDSTQSGIGSIYSNKALYLYNNGSTLKLDAYDYSTSTALDVQIGGNGGRILLSNGSVGIGTTSPAYKLEVNGTFATNNLTVLGGQLYVSPTNNNTLNSGYGVNGSADMWINYRGYNDAQSQYRNFNIGDGRGTNIFWAEGASRNVGINNGQAASYTLDVNGTIRATGDVIAYSDARVKDNIQTVENALSTITSMRGVTYTRNDSEDKSRKVGVIAQEVLPILPEVVQQDTNGNYSVAYGNMVGVLIEAIKEQQQQIEELKYLLQTINK
jgi:hypothetical protein